MAEQGKYFVQIQNPIEVRRVILETSRSVIFGLQKVERFKEKKADKMKEMERLKSTISEIQDIMSRVRKQLPQPSSSFRAKVSRPQKAKVVVKQVEGPRAEAPREMPKIKVHVPSELDKLDEELRDIESKLSDLS